MSEKTKHTAPRIHHRYGRNTVLLFALTGLMVLYPSLDDDVISGWVAFLFSSLAVLGAYYILADRPKKTVLIGMLLGLPMLAFGWMPYWQHENLHYLATISNLAFYFFVIFHVIRRVLTAPKVTPDVVAGSVVIYMLVGVIWAVIYLAINTYSPGSFHVTTDLGTASDLNRTDFLYYSFITLSTLGYGDIVPVGGLARSMAALEAMTGVVYIAVFVGRIVSLHKPMENDK